LFLDPYDMIKEFIQRALLEDTLDPEGVIPRGDHSALSCLDPLEQKKAKLIIKDEGIIAGLSIAKEIFYEVDKDLQVHILLKDGDKVKHGDIGLTVAGSATSILLAERLVLNTMQRMSGIATKTRQFVDLISHTDCKILDTRKTTPNFRYFEKMAVKIGGGVNHRFGLYDMIMLKDNRSLDEVKQVLDARGVYRIMLDNFSVEKCKEAVDFVAGKIPLEASGGITLDTIKNYAETGVDYVSVGCLTYSYKSLDISLKAF
jgi:nicotinate-nucleotide pyrophosphorylase (carboxylating)